MNIYSKELSSEESKLIKELGDLLRTKWRRNELKRKYYEGKVPLKNLGISMPRELATLTKVVLGWGDKAVNALAVRSRFDGYTYKGLEEDPLAAVLRANNFFDLYRQSVISQLTNSCAFLTVSAGDDEKNEPPVVINAYAASNAAATWNTRAKRIEAGLVVTDREKTKSGGRYGGDPAAVTLYTDEFVIECAKRPGGWNVTRTEHGYGRPLMEALIYNPTLTKPFGTSRITRAAMSTIDRAMRCAARMDIAAEFFSAPQKFLLGADEGALDGHSKWDAYIGYIFGVTRNENGELPQFGQLPQMQLTPLTDQMRNLAAEFSGETDIPLSSLGIIHDNPASAEGIYAAKEDLIVKAENLNETNGGALKNVGLMALAILGGYDSIDALPNEQKGIMPKFKSPARPSVVSQSDAIVKQVTAIPWIAETDVALEMLEYSDDQITRMKAQKTSASASATFIDTAARAKVGDEEDPDNQ